MKVEKSITITAGTERVWEALTGEIAAWWTRPYFVDGDRATGLQMDPQLGGRLVETWGEDGSGYLVGRVVEWLPPMQLGFTWMEKAWEGASTVVWVELRPEGSGTKLSLVHEGFERVPDGKATQESYAPGWEDLMAKLKAHSEA
ncbi:MAG: SRPBCC domain-containing protein [Anaerolineae bacterium]